MSPSEFIKEIWLWLMDTEGLTLNVIDEMDLFYYFDLMIYKAKKEPLGEPITTIDQVF